jgi:hypothetical protein
MSGGSCALEHGYLPRWPRVRFTFGDQLLLISERRAWFLACF